jgi:hypothetical protein
MDHKTNDFRHGKWLIVTALTGVFSYILFLIFSLLLNIKVFVYIAPETTAIGIFIAVSIMMYPILYINHLVGS